MEEEQPARSAQIQPLDITFWDSQKTFKYFWRVREPLCRSTGNDCSNIIDTGLEIVLKELWRERFWKAKSRDISLKSRLFALNQDLCNMLWNWRSNEKTA
jgi:hypothetical protein